MSEYSWLLQEPSISPELIACLPHASCVQPVVANVGLLPHSPTSNMAVALLPRLVGFVNMELPWPVGEAVSWDINSWQQLLPEATLYIQYYWGLCGQF